MALGTFLLLGLVILVGFIANLFFKKTKIPESLFLLIVGLFIGPVMNIADNSSFTAVSSFVATLALIIILLDNGLSMDIFKIFRNMPKAALFTLTVFFSTTILVTLFLLFIVGWSFLYSFLVGVVFSGTTTITVITLSTKLSISENVKQLLVLESIINDIILVIIVVTILEVVKVKSFNVVFVASSLVSAFSIAIVLGLIAVLLWLWVIRRFLGAHILIYVPTLAVLFVLYDVVELIGGSGVIAIFIFSLIIGNFHELITKIRFKKLDPEKYLTEGVKQSLETIKNVELDISFFVKTFFFVFLGVIFRREALNFNILIISFGILVLIVLARFLGVKLLMKKGPYLKSAFLIGSMLPRGYVSIVMAFFILESGILIPYLTDIVLIIILATTILAIVGSIVYEKLEGKPASKESKSNI